jgi:hypothetical protein
MFFFCLLAFNFNEIETVGSTRFAIAMGIEKVSGGKKVLITSKQNIEIAMQNFHRDLTLFPHTYALLPNPMPYNLSG